MTEQDLLRAKELFTRVRDLPLERRGAALAEACGDNAVLQHEVEELLEFDAVLGGAEDDSPEASDDRLVGRQIGQFRVRERIGCGGMAAVYAAEQLAPRRVVALKVLRAGLATKTVLRRFRHESELLARLQHPNIASIFATGTLDLDGARLPFIAMELVAAAVTITEYARQHELEAEDIVRLIATVCDAVQHGHHKGVIHRDLKPDNILVDTDGRPRLIDFGVARLLDPSAQLATLHTAPGQLIGTLHYMCPEQCTGQADDLDVRGDVYSLGVVLFEAITGTLPLDLTGDTWVSAMHRIGTESPPRPSERRQGIPSALDAITAKAMAKNRQDRYDSAGQLAADLRAFLDGAPLLAHPPGPWLRAAHWIGRHPLGTTAALCSGLVGVVAIVVWLVVRHYALTPAHVAFYEATGEVRLESRAGVELFSWQPLGRVQNASLVELGSSGNRLALVGHQVGDGTDLAGHACLYQTDAPQSQPCWTTAVELSPFEIEIDRNPQLLMTLLGTVVADVIAAVPGNELIVTQRLGPGDYTSVRVFDASGRLRYATYHRGVIHSVATIPGTNLVVAAGLNSVHTWEELGVELPEWPSVVFALRIEDGHRGPQDGIVSDREVTDPTVAWYRWFGPVETLGQQICIRLTADLTNLPNVCRIGLMQVGAYRQPDTALLTMLIDSLGSVVHRYPFDSYGAARRRGLPALADGQFLPLSMLPQPR